MPKHSFVTKCMYYIEDECREMKEEEEKLGKKKLLVPMKHKASGIISTPFWIKLFRLWPDLWIMMDCITWNQDRHSTWNCHAFDSASLVTIPLESKEAEYITVRQDTMTVSFLSCSLFTMMMDFSVNSNSLKIGVLCNILNSQYVESCSVKQLLIVCRSR